MKDFIIIIGCLGGIIYVAESVCWIVHKLLNFRNKYQKMKWFYEKNHQSIGERPTMGFKTKSEQEEIEAKMQERRAS